MLFARTANVFHCAPKTSRVTTIITLFTDSVILSRGISEEAPLIISRRNIAPSLWNLTDGRHTLRKWLTNFFITGISPPLSFSSPPSLSFLKRLALKRSSNRICFNIFLIRKIYIASESENIRKFNFTVKISIVWNCVCVLFSFST